MYLGIALMSQKKLDEAKPELERAVSTNSSEVAMAHRYLGGLYWGERDYKRAADELEAYLKLVPKAADAEKTKAAIKDLRSKQ
jgi:regulator of sirC expression with transglutaminase-like and TPR domain